jgi:uncharacterized membrane protein HdeD (DUF308 family)
MNNSLIRISFAAIIGVVLMVWPAEATEYMVRTVGFLFIVVGVISFLAYYATRRKYRKIKAIDADSTGEVRAPRFPIEGIGSILLGIWLNVTPTTVITILMYVLGFVILMGGVWQLANLLNARRWAKVPLLFYILPTLILLAGIFIVANPGEFSDSIVTVIGVTFVIYALFELINWFKFTRHKPAQTISDAVIVEEVKDEEKKEETAE